MRALLAIIVYLLLCFVLGLVMAFTTKPNGTWPKPPPAITRTSCV